MSSPCPGPRFIRCRVRDLASCFYACRLPLEEDQPEKLRSKPTEMSNGSINNEFSGGGGGRNGSRKVSTAKKIGRESSVKTSSSSNISNNRITGGMQAEPHFAEEDYIVFCFREDGAIDMINNEGKQEDEEHYTPTTTPPAVPITSEKGDEKGSNKTGSERRGPDDEIKETVQPASMEKPNSSKVESCESSDSNLSDATSTSSFAFPVMGIEWIGSPVHMPKSAGDESMRLHCCRF